MGSEMCIRDSANSGQTCLFVDGVSVSGEHFLRLSTTHTASQYYDPHRTSTLHSPQCATCIFVRVPHSRTHVDKSHVEALAVTIFLVHFTRQVGQPSSLVLTAYVVIAWVEVLETLCTLLANGFARLVEAAQITHECDVVEDELQGVPRTNFRSATHCENRAFYRPYTQLRKK